MKKQNERLAEIKGGHIQRSALSERDRNLKSVEIEWINTTASFALIMGWSFEEAALKMTPPRLADLTSPPD